MTNWYDPDTLPKFRFPPVDETAVAVEFGPVAEFDYLQLLRLQDQFLPDYSVVTEQNGAPPSSLVSPAPPAFELNWGMPPRRVWNVGPGTGRLIQTQQDRLILNWRRNDSTDGYPGYRDSLRGEFERLWAVMTGFMATRELPQPVPVLAEFDYVNKVPLLEGDTLAEVVTLIQTPEVEVPGVDTFGRFQFVRDVEESETDPYRAQIVVTGEPGVPDEGRLLVFTIAVKVLLSGSTDVMAAADAAHALASHTFARIITPEKKKEWEQFQ
ncbi:MAG: hypothetical protein JWO18_2803 [Microbacteriaceae bacterium]|nr:hypothetical protein [Microbacteriaceae bacterium]